MMGYNCTIFAYGQTGTGKTHTMEGNLDDIQGTQVNHDFSRSGIDAGIIPRTLYKLFEILETVAEFSVRVSVNNSLLILHNFTVFGTLQRRIE